MMLNKARLHMTRIELSPGLLHGLEKKTLTYNFKDWDSAVWTLHEGIRSRTLPATILKKWPRRITIVMYDEESDVDSDKNPFYFKHNNVRDITVDISGVKYAKTQLNWDFVGRNWNTASVYYENAVTYGAIDDFPYSFQDFLDVYTVFLFDTTRSRYFNFIYLH
jgi:hypothetical protein